MATNLFSKGTRLRGAVPHLFAGLFWLVAAAIGGTFVLGCNSIGGGFNTTSGQTMAISMSGQIKLYNPISALASMGLTPVPVQTLTAANVLSVAFDHQGNLYYLANNGTAGSAATFYFCHLPTGGLPYIACTAQGSTIDGGQWLAIDQSGTAFATSLSTTTGTVVSFPASSGPPVSPTVVYTSAVKPFAYGGIAVDSSDTIYLTEQLAAASYPDDKLFKCTTACQSSSGSQTNLTVSGSYPGSVISGPLAIGHDGATLLVAAGNINNHTSLTLPVVFVCAASGGGGLTCQADVDTFPAVFGVDNPYVMTVGVTSSSTNDVYAAVQLNDGGDTTTNFAPSFFGFVQAGTQFACSSTPSNCRVNQLPAPLIDSAAGSVPYGLAISP